MYLRNQKKVDFIIKNKKTCFEAKKTESELTENEFTPASFGEILEVPNELKLKQSNEEAEESNELLKLNQSTQLGNILPVVSTLNSNPLSSPKKTDKRKRISVIEVFFEIL